MLQTLHFLTDSSKIAFVTFNFLLLDGFVYVFRKYEACYLIQIMKLNHNQFNLFVACLGFEQLYLDGFVYVIWKYEECYLLQLMLLNHKHNKFNLVVACLGFEQLIICLSFMTWIQIYFSVLGFEYSLKYGFVLLARIRTRVGIPTFSDSSIF